MGDDLSTRLRRAAYYSDSLLEIDAVEAHGLYALLQTAADAIDVLTRELAAAIAQRERMIDAMKEAQAKLREMQDYIITPKDDGL